MIRAYITDSAMGFGVIGIRIVLHPGDDARLPARLLRFAEDGSTRFDDIEEGAVIPATLSLPDDMARALLDGLTRHYHGAEDTRALRGDYDAERKRVDGLITVVSGIAERLSETSPLPPAGLHGTGRQ